MKSIPLKVILGILLTISILIGVVLYVKADLNESFEDEEVVGYAIKSSASTNLNASLKAHPRASEYTSAEYSAKLAPEQTSASEYLAQYEETQDGGGNYRRKSAPQEISADDTIGGEKTNKKLSVYPSTLPETNATGDEDNAYEMSNKKKVIVSSDGYPRRRQNIKTDYSRSIKNAAQNDDAYQVKKIDQSVANETYGGYKVRSSRGKDIKVVKDENVNKNIESLSSKNRIVKVKRNQQAPSSGKTYGGYKVRSAGVVDNESSTTRSLADYNKSYKENNYESRTYPTTSFVNISGGEGTKVYNNKGERVGIYESQFDKSVIVLPFRGRSIAGVVVNEERGKSIVVESTSGVKSTYRYGEIDALLNL